MNYLLATKEYRKLTSENASTTHFKPTSSALRCKAVLQVRSSQDIHPFPVRMGEKRECIFVLNFVSLNSHVCTTVSNPLKKTSYIYIYIYKEFMVSILLT